MGSNPASPANKISKLQAATRDLFVFSAMDQIYNAMHRKIISGKTFPAGKNFSPIHHVLFAQSFSLLSLRMKIFSLPGILHAHILFQSF